MQATRNAKNVHSELVRAIDALSGRDATFYGITSTDSTSASQYGPNAGSLAEQTGGGSAEGANPENPNVYYMSPDGTQIRWVIEPYPLSTP